MMKCLHCNEIYNDEWYSSPKCGNVSVKCEDEQTVESTKPKSDQLEENHENLDMPPFSKLPSVFYIVAFIIMFSGVISLFYFPHELVIVLSVLWASFTSALMFVGFGKVIEILDFIKWKK